MRKCLLFIVQDGGKLTQRHYHDVAPKQHSQEPSYQELGPEAYVFNFVPPDMQGPRQLTDRVQWQDPYSISCRLGWPDQGQGH